MCKTKGLWPHVHHYFRKTHFSTFCSALAGTKSISSIHSRFCSHLAEMWCCILRLQPHNITFSIQQPATTFWAQNNLFQQVQGQSTGWTRPTGVAAKTGTCFPGFFQPWNQNRDCSASWLHCLVIPLGASHLLAEHRKHSEQSNGSPPAVKRLLNLIWYKSIEQQVLHQWVGEQTKGIIRKGKLSYRNGKGRERLEQYRKGNEGKGPPKPKAGIFLGVWQSEQAVRREGVKGSYIKVAINL